MRSLPEVVGAEQSILRACNWAYKPQSILRFLHTYSHSNTISELEHDPSVLSETRAVLCDLLELMKECDPTHYAGMINIVAPAEPQSEEESLRPE